MFLSIYSMCYEGAEILTIGSLRLFILGELWN